MVDLKGRTDLIHRQVRLGMQINDSMAALLRCGQDRLRGKKSDAAQFGVHRKPVCMQVHRGFESHPLRSSKKQPSQVDGCFQLSDWLHGHGKAALCEAKFYGLHDRKNPANAALNVYRASDGTWFVLIVTPDKLAAVAFEV